MGDERTGINLSCRYQTKYLVATATVYPSGFKDKVLSVHVRKGKLLRMVVECNNGYDGIGAGTLPRQKEGFVRYRHFQHADCSAMIAVCFYK